MNQLWSTESLPKSVRVRFVPATATRRGPGLSIVSFEKPHPIPAFPTSVKFVAATMDTEPIMDVWCTRHRYVQFPRRSGTKDHVMIVFDGAWKSGELGSPGSGCKLSL